MSRIALQLTLLALLAICYANNWVGATSIFLDSRPQDLVIDPCFDSKQKKPVSCVPDFVNAAFGVRVEASSTCGKNQQDFCTTINGKEECKVCDNTKDDLAHPAEFLTDLHNPNNETCWHSDFVGNDTVTLTISLKKKYELTYISLHFCHEKPDSLAIHKSMDHGKTWQPFQFYSSDCLGTFERRKEVSITRANEQEALCVDSHLQQDSGTRIAFSTLADRPSAEDFEHSPVLQDWVTATDIKLTFPPLKDTDDYYDDDDDEEDYDDGLELSNLVAELKSPSSRSSQIQIRGQKDIKDTKKNKKNQRRWIGISDLAIGGRCKCNGHASDCSLDPMTGEMKCNCQHNTDGKECEKCKGKGG